jgi:putative transposase
MDSFADRLIATCTGSELAAWCVLPNHYHILVRTSHLPDLIRRLGALHGRCSRAWNREDATTGRTVFHRSSDRYIRSTRHFWATLNYIHHNPVRHGYVCRWTDWPWSSATDYLRLTGREHAAHIWKTYPVLD